MARKLRVEYPGAIYHLMNRGDRREDIFKDAEDRKRFLATLGEACDKAGWQVHAWCLMPNHFHLVIETPRGGLVAGMKWMLGTYTGRFNRRHRRVGHLFSGRYKALIVEGTGNGYLKTVCDYVHLNPARAKLVKGEQALSKYRWSSWPEYLKAPSRRWRWLRVDRLLGENRIPKDSPSGRRRLEEGLEERRQQEEGEVFKAVRRGWFLGEAELKEQLLAQMGRAMGEHHGGEERQESAVELAERIVRQELKRRRWREALLEERRKGDAGKVEMARRLRRETTMTLKWIARRLRMGSASMVTHCLQRQQGE
jgi:putative transposase